MNRRNRFAGTPFDPMFEVFQKEDDPTGTYCRVLSNLDPDRHRYDRAVLLGGPDMQPIPELREFRNILAWYEFGEKYRQYDGRGYLIYKAVQDDRLRWMEVRFPLEDLGLYRLDGRGDLVLVEPRRTVWFREPLDSTGGPIFARRPFRSEHKYFDGRWRLMLHFEDGDSFDVPIRELARIWPGVGSPRVYIHHEVPAAVSSS